MAKYRIEADSVEELTARVVYLLKRGVENEDFEPQGPNNNRLSCVLADGSKVSIRLGKKEFDDVVKDGIEIDGQPLNLPESCRFCNTAATYTTEDGVPVCGGVKCMNAYREN